VDWLVGVDLSDGMVAQARRKGLYDRLVALDLCAFLRDEAAGGFHLMVAADVFVYFADLDAVVAAAARMLAPDGFFAFTTETHKGDGVILRETLRYAHSEACVRAALEQAGLRPLLLEPVSTRTEKQQPVPGLLVVAALSASPFTASKAP
jgi:predicted TPR repeat methyltransferase